MLSIAKRWMAVGGFAGAIGVALGAYGAHGLDRHLQTLGYVGEELAHRLDIFNTAAQYQVLHALALVLTGLALQYRASVWWRVAAWAFVVGILLFCGLLEVLTFAGPQWKRLGAVVPMGGLSLIAAWVALALGALAKTPGANELN
jgi:uncharacterized membrane protein YgdD (TMEM256/DUF423 family)